MEHTSFTERIQDFEERPNLSEIVVPIRSAAASISLPQVWSSKESLSPSRGPEVVPRRTEDALHDSLTSIDAQSANLSDSVHGQVMSCAVWILRVNLEVERSQGDIDCRDWAWPGQSFGTIVEVRVSGRMPSSLLNSETDVSRIAIAA